MSQRIENLTLREKLSEADKLVRELIHHLEHGFIPKTHKVRLETRSASERGDTVEVSDQTIRNLVEGLLASDDFACEVSEKMNRYLKAIDADLDRILAGR